MCMQTNLLLHLPLNNFNFYCFVFGATLLQYNLHYTFKTAAFENSVRLRWSSKNKSVHRMLILAGLVLTLTSLFNFHLHHILFLLIPGIIAVMYSFPLLPFANKRRLKDYGLVKIITLSLLWSFITVWFPVDSAHYSDLSFHLIFIRRFFFIFILCLLFDIRDIEIDKKENINTIPVWVGIRKAYAVAYVLLFFFIALSVIQLIYNHSTNQFIAMCISAIATAITIEFSKKNHSDFVYLVCVDGMMILQAGLVALCLI